jgi:uncharacterized protein (DUF697 family)
MSRKNLPKAIRRTAEDMSWIAATPAAKSETPARATELSVVAGGKPVVTDPRPVAIIDATPAIATSMVEAPIVEILPAPAAGAPDHVSPVSAGADAAQRLSFAHAIVERHATYSAVGGAIPMPVVNFASMTAVIVRMVKRLSSLYDVPFDRRRTRAIVTALTGGAAHTGFTMVAASALSLVAPAGLIVGVATSSIAAAACTRTIGRMFVEHFERGETLQDFPTARRR